jgi:hypothetical protein
MHKQYSYSGSDTAAERALDHRGHQQMNKLFLIFIILSVLITFCFRWGLSLNRRKAHDIFHVLEDIFTPKEKSYTNIGGSVGYHARYTFDDNIIDRIDLTLLLLPRHSLLWLPFSKLIFKDDRLFIRIALKKQWGCRISIFGKKYYASRKTSYCFNDEYISEDMLLKNMPYIAFYRKDVDSANCLFFLKNNPFIYLFRELSFSDREINISLHPHSGTSSEAIRSLYSFICDERSYMTE